MKREFKVQQGKQDRY